MINRLSSRVRPTWPLQVIGILTLLAVQIAALAPVHSADAASAQTAASPLPVTGQFAGISCTSRSNCWAAGVTNSGQWQTQLEMAHWNGKAWTSVPSPIVSLDASGDQRPYKLLSFTCAGRNSCWAVGFTQSKTLILRWNGQKWSVEWSRGYTYLSAIACPSSAGCWAVGTWLAHEGAHGGVEATWGSLILHRTGRRWTLVRSPNPSRAAAIAGCTLPGSLDAVCYSNHLLSVGCASVRVCWAAGVDMVQGQQGQSSPAIRGELIRWNGVRWSIGHAPLPTGSLTTVACTSKANCWALGSSAAGQTVPHLVALLWNGTRWSLVPTDTVPALIPYVGGLGVAGLVSASCGTAADCWAVGIRYPGACGTASYPIAIHWDGRTWSDKLSTLPTGALLFGITMLTAHDGWAVGQDGYGIQGLQDIFHWDGSRWTSLRQSGSALFAPSQSQVTSSEC